MAGSRRGTKGERHLTCNMHTVEGCRETVDIITRVRWETFRNAAKEWLRLGGREAAAIQSIRGDLDKEFDDLEPKPRCHYSCYRNITNKRRLSQATKRDEKAKREGKHAEGGNSALDSLVIPVDLEYMSTHAESKARKENCAQASDLNVTARQFLDAESSLAAAFGGQYKRWTELRNQLKIGHEDLAKLLLDSYHVCSCRCEREDLGIREVDESVLGDVTGQDMTTTRGQQQSIQDKTEAHNQNVNIDVTDVADNNSDNEECFDEDKEGSWPVLHADDEDMENKPTGTKSISENDLCVEKDDERESFTIRRTSLHADVKGVYIYINTKRKDENDDETCNLGENVPFQVVSKDLLRESKKTIHDEILNIEDIIKKMEQNKKNKVKDKEKTQYFCQFCGIVYKSYKSCVKHEQKHINQNVFTRLKKTRTEKRDFMCMYCGHTFATNFACEEHERIHTGERPYKCQFCDKSFYMAGSKVRHENIHTNEKVYLCYFCGKIFNSRSSKAQHENIHTGEKPYKCQFCQKAFGNKFAVKVHERIHTGEKPYKCQFCEKSFKQRNKRKNHERVHTGERPYKCRYCEKVFSYNVNRRLHEKKHSSQNLLLT